MRPGVPPVQPAGRTVTNCGLPPPRSDPTARGSGESSLEKAPGAPTAPRLSGRTVPFSTLCQAEQPLEARDAGRRQGHLSSAGSASRKWGDQRNADPSCAMPIQSREFPTRGGRLFSARKRASRFLAGEVDPASGRHREDLIGGPHAAKTLAVLAIMPLVFEYKSSLTSD